jgi:subtilisin family serine protease
VTVRALIYPALLAIVLALPAASAAQSGSERYIVVLEDRVENPGKVATDHARRYGASPRFVYRHALEGYAARIPEQRVDDVRRDSRVAFVDRDGPVEAFAQQVPTGVQRIFADDNAALDIDSTDDYRVDADVAVIDTGIDYDHPELDVRTGTKCSGGSPWKQSCSGTAPADGDDDNGHGTHVAGTAAAIDNGRGVVGVAPGARLHAVKVLKSDGSGWTSWIIAGIDYVTKNASTIEVANMSLGGSGMDDGRSCADTTDAEKKAICNSVDAGVVYAVAAGNEDSDAAGSTPANHPDVITVSALADFDGEPGALGAPTCRPDQDDTLADFSNWGSLVEVAAPGTCIHSTVPGGGYDTYSGTSMASPHVAGAAALLASGPNDPTTRTQVEAIRDQIVASGNPGWTDDSGDGIPEPLLDVGTFTATLVPAPGGEGDGGGGDPDPGATPFSLTATGYKVKGNQKADLKWSGATSTNVDVYRDGSKLTTTANDGFHTDNIDRKGGGSYTYKLCEAGSTTACSNEVTVTF